MATEKLKLIFYTVRFLKPRQVFYQVYYRLKRRLTGTTPIIPKPSSFAVQSLVLEPSIAAHRTFLGNSTFVFLNKEKAFEENIDWNYLSFGKLWAYNLNYFDFLNQPALPEKDGVSLIAAYCKNHGALRQGLEPYPISLRGINWIKFFTRHQIVNPAYNAVLYSHYRLLSSNVEYHLLGNHLLENGFSLLFGAYYFRDTTFLRKAEKIIRDELNEQILEDGAHFELSPMYHCILLHRLLDCINLVQRNPWKATLNSVMTEKASAMLGWLQQITFENGDLPAVNDTIAGGAPVPGELLQYADRLGIVPDRRPLSASGYRMIRTPSFELFVDIGNIGPDYIPGHAHSDTLSFVLYRRGQGVVVDTGTSTYEESALRILERSTESHNTVTINNRNQSEVWKSFRVGRRAKITFLQETDGAITAAHDGYKFLGYTHRRTWRWTDNTLIIRDEITGAGAEPRSAAHLHFLPAERVVVDDRCAYAGDIRITSTSKFSSGTYRYAAGYNKTVSSTVLTTHFHRENEIEFTFAHAQPAGAGSE